MPIETFLKNHESNERKTERRNVKYADLPVNEVRH